MHIEPGFVAAGKVLAANGAAVGLVLTQLKDVLKKPFILVQAAVAALFFSIFMQSFHMPVGPSELHFIGASVMYLTLGFTPTMLGFALGLLLQGVFFNPGDVYHLGVNSLSLMVPLAAMHYAMGRRLFCGEEGKASCRALTWRRILEIDAAYYAGVTFMVGFWLAVGEVETPFQAWAAFASSYIPVVLVEPIFSFGVVRLMKKLEGKPIVADIFAVNRLRLQ